jgi:hypothetical protein
MISVNYNGSKYSRCNAEFVFCVIMHLKDDESHAALFPHDLSELFDIFGPMYFSRSV